MKDTPILNEKELEAIDKLTKRYDKMIEPSVVSKIGTKVVEKVPDSVKKVISDIGMSITEQEFYEKTMEVVTKGFKTVEQYAAKYTINEQSIISKINEVSEGYKIKSIEECCLCRSYDIAKAVTRYKTIDISSAFVEGGVTGAAGFWGLPFNIVLSTFLYFRAVQSIAMYYGYDVKNDSEEMVIAMEVFTKALSPAQNDVNNEFNVLIGKIMVMSQAAVVKQTSKKTWTEMARRGGIPLLLAQMRALAHKSAQNALNNAGRKGLEHSLFADAFEQIGRKLTLKSIPKSVPVASAVIGALLDTAQMSKVLDFADVFYQKRFLIEKEARVHNLMKDDVIVIDVEEKDD